MDAEAIRLLGRAILAAIEANELERAASLVAQAECANENVSFGDRAAVVLETTRAIAAAKRAKSETLAAAAALPVVTRLDLELRVLGPLDRLLEREIDKLRAEKRRLSRPS